MSDVSVVLPWPPKALSPNGRLHWAKTARAKKAYREACYYEALSQGLSARSFSPAPKIALELAIYPPDQRLRDVDNIVASLKAGLDGVADALGLNDHRFVLTPRLMPQVGGFIRATLAEIPEELPA